MHLYLQYVHVLRNYMKWMYTNFESHRSIIFRDKYHFENAYWFWKKTWRSFVQLYFQLRYNRNLMTNEKVSAIANSTMQTSFLFLSDFIWT